MRRDIGEPLSPGRRLSACLPAEDGATLTVTDLNSTNGTYVNGKQLQPMEATEVKLKQEVTFGALKPPDSLSLLWMS